MGMTIFVLRDGTSIDSATIRDTGHFAHHIIGLRSNSKTEAQCLYISWIGGYLAEPEDRCCSAEIQNILIQSQNPSSGNGFQYGLLTVTSLLWMFVPVLLDYQFIIEAFRFLQQFY